MAKIKTIYYWLTVCLIIFSVDIFLFSYDGNEILLREIQDPTAGMLKTEKIEYYTQKGDSYLKKSEYNSAIVAYKEALKLKKKNPEVVFKLGEAYRQAEIDTEAIEYYTQAVKYGINRAEVYLGFGMTYKKRFNYEMAEKQFDKAIEYDKNNIQIMKEIMDLYYRQGKYDKAIITAKKILSINGNDGNALNILIRSQILTGNFTEAKKYAGIDTNTKLMDDYIQVKINAKKPEESFGDGNGRILKAIFALRENNPRYAKKILETLIESKENTLSVKLGKRLYSEIK